VNWAGIGEALVILMSAAAATRHVPLALAVAVGFVYATATSDAGYWLGYRGGRPFVERVAARFPIGPEHMASAELFFSHHGDRAVVASPFIVGMRTWGSMLAGMSRMPFWRFQLLSAAGALAWSTLVAAAGYLLGSNLPVLEAIVRVIGVGGVVFVVVIVSFLLVAQERATRRR
jgi:membrane protein DedA with SNARE-associated domain